MQRITKCSCSWLMSLLQIIRFLKYLKYANHFFSHSLSLSLRLSKHTQNTELSSSFPSIPSSSSSSSLHLLANSCYIKPLSYTPLSPPDSILTNPYHFNSPPHHPDIT